ncbi:MAG: bifunctional riboflavin kinase/FAD synthetase [Deltaproteobacteria bacterium]|nr:MAG: bifunctional riboflavin kinase/FAD synthetase [Deltaproteobacteria bacterium]
MKVIRELENLKGVANSPVLTIGNFDGVHWGHRQIFSKVVEKARQLQVDSMVLTFDPHTLNLLQPNREPFLLTTFEEKTGLIDREGIDLLVAAAFNQDLAAYSPRRFVSEVLGKQLAPVEILVGENFSFGQGGEGGNELLKEMGKELGFKVNTVEPVTIDGVIISSSRIRELIRTGRVREAAGLLGRNYTLKRPVISGCGRGKSIGFPTANFEPGEKLLPRDGVYAAWVNYQSRYKGAVNIGTNPTFPDTPSGPKVGVEVHILDFNGEICGEIIEIEFIERIRDELTFSGPAELHEQIEKDLVRVNEILEPHPGRVKEQ